ncbi:hypothetical protein GCM10020331_017830 [Ectobacillus funiculus]
MTEGQRLNRGQELTEGSIDPKELLKVKDMNAVQEYLLREVQKVYRMQGVEIGDKHVEVMVRQMLRKVRVMDAGDTDVLPGTLLDIHQFTDANEKKYCLKVNSLLQHVLFFSVLQRHRLRQIPSCPLHPSKKQHVFLLTQLSKESAMSFLV